MDVVEFKKDFMESVRATAANIQDGTTASFVAEVAQVLLDREVISDYELCFFTGTGQRNRRLRVDGYSFDEVDESLNLFVVDFDGGDDPETLTMTHARQSFDRLAYFVDEALTRGLANSIEISAPVYDLIDLLKANMQRIRRFRFILMTDRAASDRIETLENGKIGSAQVEYHIWDIGRLYRLCNSQSGREEIEVDFRRYTSNGIPCLDAGDAETEEYKSYLCVLPGAVLADVYDDYGSRLLEGNVRSFLSTKVAVNKKIRATILNQPSRFFAYNNGIAATASEVCVEEGATGRYIVKIRGLQIVNGGQTTASLSAARYKDKADLVNIFVQMKLTQVNATLAETIIPDISRSSNSQNKVSEADFFSNHPFHVRMEKVSRRIFAPSVGGAQHETHWFYERARGQYAQEQSKLTRNEKGKFLLQNPKDQLITKTDLAKVRNAWRGYPHKVSLGAQKNFMVFAEWVTEEWDRDDALFNEVFYQDAVALYIIFRSVERIVSAQSWYEKGYRANIVAYTVALLAYSLHKAYPNQRIDLQAIWNKQCLNAILEKQLAYIAKIAFDVLTSEARPIQNVTEWSKRDLCWEYMKKESIKLLPEMSSLLVQAEEVKSSVRAARRDQVLVSGIEAQMYVVELGSAYWAGLLNWGRIKNLLSPDDTRLLTIASRMTDRSMPNAVQSQKLQELRNRLISEGLHEGETA